MKINREELDKKLQEIRDKNLQARNLLNESNKLLSELEMWLDKQLLKQELTKEI